MNKKVQNSIGWIDGKWGSTGTLNIPINDRGLRIADGIFETIAIADGEPKLIEDHIKRFQEGASLLGMAPPPPQKTIVPLIQQGIDKLSFPKGYGVLRLNWSRGSTNQRGICINEETNRVSNHRFWLEIHSAEPMFNSISTIISQYEQRNPNSKLSHCKSFNYGQPVQAKREAILAGADEAILLSTNGKICCGSTSNLIILRKNKWLTPSVKTGCLSGIMRQQGFKAGIFNEAEISPEPEEKDQWLLINSLSCRPIKSLNGQPLTIYSESKELWEMLSNL